MVEIIATEFRDLKDLINASRSVSGIVVAYRYGEIRIYKGLAYIASSLGRNYWYILYTKNFNISPDTEVIEYTSSGEIREVSVADMGRDPKAIYYTVIKPIKDDVIETLLNKLKKHSTI